MDRLNSKLKNKITVRVSFVRIMTLSKIIESIFHIYLRFLKLFLLFPEVIIDDENSMLAGVVVIHPNPQTALK